MEASFALEATHAGRQDACTTALNSVLQQRKQQATSNATTTGEQLEDAPRLVGVKQAPEWLQRPFITSGYLVGGSPAQALMATLFGFNNETLNAHTMVWAAALSTWLYWCIREELPGSSVVPFTLFWLSCVVHMPFSVGLHCTIGVSAEQRSTWRSLDIGFIFTCSVILAAAMGWYVFPSRAGYAVFLAASLGVYGRVVWETMVVRRMRDIPKKQTARYVAVVVLTYAVPMLWAALREVVEGGGRPGPVARQVGLIAAVLFVGGELYARHYPERLLPGAFDLLLNSHQLMHLLAMAAHWLEWRLLAHLAAAAGDLGPEWLAGGTGGLRHLWAHGGSSAAASVWPARHEFA